MPSTSSELIDRPSQVYDAIEKTIRDALNAGDGSGVTIGGYDEWRLEQADDRQVLIEFAGFSPGKPQNDGRQSQVIEIVLYAVISMGCEKYSKQAFNLASSLARLAGSNRWGLSHKVIDEPGDASASPSFLVKASDKSKGFEAWEARFEQLVKYGADGWADDESMEERQFMLAINPADPDDDAEYLPIESYGAEE